MKYGQMNYGKYDKPTRAWFDMPSRSALYFYEIPRGRSRTAQECEWNAYQAYKKGRVRFVAAWVVAFLSAAYTFRYYGYEPALFVFITAVVVGWIMLSHSEQEATRAEEVQVRKILEGGNYYMQSRGKVPKAIRELWEEDRDER